jgi:phosphoglycerate kinase
MNLRKLTPEVVKNKIVLLRCDFNVPIKNGQVVENTRLKAALPTINFLLKNEVKELHILTHLGRPKGVPDLKFTVAPVALELEKLIGETVEFRPDFSSGKTRIQLHENTRFYPGEKTNDETLAREIIEKTKAEIFVIDCFAAIHRAHASVIGPARFLPTFTGFLIESEIAHLSPFLTNKKIPGLTVLISGMKMETKVPVLKKLSEIAENVLVGGALANTFLAARGENIGSSFFEESEFENAREVMADMKKNNTNFILPQDAICALEIDSNDASTKENSDIPVNLKIFDIGPKTIESFKKVLENSKIIIWNGPLGVFENPSFSNGTKEIAKLIAKTKFTQTILGGGDTITAIKKFGFALTDFTHVSTGGGAMLEFLEGKDLPGLSVLKI